MPGDGSWRVEVIGCRLPTGVVVPVNSSHIEGNDEWKCSIAADGKITMQQGVNAYAKCGNRNFGKYLHFKK